MSSTTTTTTTSVTYSGGFYNSTYEHLALAYSATAVAVGILLGLLGKFHLMFNLIDALGIIYFLFFVQVNPPTNVLDFHKMFGDFHYDFMYDYLKSSVSNSYQYYTSNMFKAYGFDSFFLNNTSLSFCIIIGMIGVYVLFKIMSFIPMRGLQFYLKYYLQTAWEFDYFIYILWIFYNQFSVFFFLQFDAMDFDSTLKKVNFVIFVLVGLILFASPVLLWYLIQKNQEQLGLPASMRQYQIRYFSIVSGLKINIDNYQNANANQQNNSLTKDQNSHRDNQDERIASNSNQQMHYTSFGKYMNIFIFIRKLLFAGVLVQLQGYRTISLGIFSGANILLLLLYVISRPHLLLIDNIKNGLTEACFISIQVLIYFFDSIKSSSSTSTVFNTSDQQLKLGWAYISICVFVLGIHLIDVLVRLFIQVYSIIKNRSQKVAPLPIHQENILQKEQHLEEQENKQAIEMQQQPQDQLTVIPLNQQQNMDNQSLVQNENKQIPQNQNVPVSLQNIQLNNGQSKPEINQIQRKIEEGPMKTAKTSFNDFLISDNMLPNLSNAEERYKYKQRVKPLLFKRNPYIPKDGYYDGIIHNGDIKTNKGIKRLEMNGNVPQTNNQHMMDRQTDVDIQNF